MNSRLLAGRYELIEKTGEGGMAIVYKGKDRLLNRYVAIKILRPEFTIDEKFLGEARDKALRFARRCYSGWASDADCEDMVHDAFLTMYRKIQDGSLTELTCSLSTLVISFVMNLAKKRRQEQHAVIDTIPMLAGQDENDALDIVDITVAREAIKKWMGDEQDMDHEQQLEAVRQLVENMPEPCKTILWNYYWGGKSMKEIAEAMNYNNADVAKSQKSKCMTKVRAAMGEIINRLRL